MTQIQKIHNLTGHRDCVYALQQGEQSNQFFSGAGDGLIVLWDLENPEEGELIAKLPNSVYAFHFLQQQSLLVAGHNYEGIHVLDWKSKKELTSLQLGKAAIFDIQSFENNLYVASGDGTVSVVDILNWSIKRKITFSEKSARAMAINTTRG